MRTEGTQGGERGSLGTRHTIACMRRRWLGKGKHRPRIALVAAAQLALTSMVSLQDESSSTPLPSFLAWSFFPAERGLECVTFQPTRRLVVCSTHFHRHRRHLQQLQVTLNA